MKFRDDISIVLQKVMHTTEEFYKKTKSGCI